MSEKLRYVRLKNYDGRTYRITSDAKHAVNGEHVLFVVAGPDVGSYKKARKQDVRPLTEKEKLDDFYRRTGRVETIVRSR